MMKQLNLDICTGQAYDCFDVLIKSICDWKNIDYRMMFTESWGFDYNQDNTNATLTDRLRVGRGDQVSYLQDYHGLFISQKPYHASVIQEINTFIDEGQPVMLFVDSYWCKWDFVRYQKSHANHFICVTGYDDSTNEYLCKDYQMALKGQILAAEDFENYCQEFHFIHFSEAKQNIDAKEILSKFANRLLDPNGNIRIGNDIRAFAKDLEQLDFVREFENDIDAGQSALFRRLSQIGQSRAKFIQTMECMESKCNGYNFQENIEEIRTLGSQWEVALAMLMKSYYMKDRTKILNRICDKYREIAEWEDTIIAKLRNKQPDFGKSTPEDRLHRNDLRLEPITVCTVLDLSSHLNNNGIYNKITSDCSCELSNPCRYFLIEEGTRNGKHEVMELAIRNFNQDLPDNIACDRQVIDVDIEHPKYLALLACSEFGSFKEKIHLVYDSKDVKFDIGFTSWLAQLPEYGEAIAITGKGVLRKKDSAECYPFPVHIYSRILQLDPEYGHLKSVVLPECINIHIFSISVGS